MENKRDREGLVSLSAAFPQGAPEAQVRQIAKDLAAALADCAREGVVHQAVKASNVFLTPDGRYRLGSPPTGKEAKMPCGGDISCMCPEMYWGESFDCRADVYALGILLYTLLNNGIPPLAENGADSRGACLRRLEGEELPLPKNGSAELCRVVLRACAYEPAHRFQSVGELICALGGDCRG